MPASSPWPERLSRLEVLSYSTILVLAVMYFFILHILDGRAARYFEGLRDTHPDLYMTQLRERRGFDVYLAAYSKAEGFGTFRTSVPNFLVGRWSMQPQPVRMIPGKLLADCSNPITFDYGRILIRDFGGKSTPVQYKISGETVEIRGTSSDPLPVHLISYGSELDHLEFVPPGKTDKVYAYRCGL